MRGRAGVAQRIIDHRQHALQISIDFIVPETQYREASAGEVIVTLRIAPRMRIEIMLTAIDLNYEVVFETDEIYDMAVARGLPDHRGALQPRGTLPAKVCARRRRA